MTKFSTPGSPFHQICTLWLPKEISFADCDILITQLTWFRERHNVSHVSHEDPALQLELGVLVSGLGA